MSTLTKISFLILTLLGWTVIHGIAIKTGYYDLMNASKAKEILADGTPYRGRITGVAAIDDTLLTLVQFFWPVVDGNAPNLSLMGFLFVGQATALMVIIMLEGWRSGNKGKAISFVSVYGLLFQTASIAVMGPAYLLLYTLTSSTQLSPTPANLAVDLGLLSGIPFALIVGFVLPTVVMALPVPAYLSVQGRVNAIAAWQLAPIYTVLLAYLWKSFTSSGFNTSPREQIHRYRSAYKSGLYIAVPAHIATSTLSIVALVLPQVYSAKFAIAFHPLNSIIPANPLHYSASTVSSGAQGSLTILQWDFLTVSVSYLIFAVNARFTKAVDPKGFKASDQLGMLARIAVMGPLGTALTYMWERDEIVFGKVIGEKKVN